MTHTQRIEAAILDALATLQRATARQIETFPAVAHACRAAKLKARTILEGMRHTGKVQSDGAYQGAVYWTP